MLKKYSLIFFVLSIGLGFSYFLNNYLIIQHNKKDKEKFEDLSEQRFISFNRALNEDLSFMKYLAHFFQTRKNVTREEFKQLTEPFIDSHPAIDKIAWVPKVSRYNIDQWTAQVYEEAFIYFSPFDTPVRESYETELEREYIYPKFYVSPSSSKDKLLDEDIGKNKQFLESIEQADKSKRQVTSEAFYLDNDKNKSLLVNVFTPVFHADPKHPSYKQLEGVLLLEVKMADFFDYAIVNVFDEEGLKVKIEELDTETHLGGDKWNSEQLVDYYSAEEVIDTSTTDEVFAEYTGRLWRLSVIAPYHFGEEMNIVRENISLIIGSLITFLVTLIVFIQQRQTARVQVQVQQRTQELALSEAISNSILDSAADAIFSVNEKGIVSRINQAAIKLLGYREEELIGQSLKLIVPACVNDNDNVCNFNEFKKEKGAETDILNRSGNEITVNLSITDIGFDGKFQYTCMMHDLTETKAVQKTLESLSQTDSLTTLYNRRYFDSQMESVWELAIRDESSISLIMIDIDHFKLYNDHYGHTKGDKCLQEVSIALKQSFHRSIDIVARYGGEEFIVLLPKTTDVEQMAQTCIENIRDLSIPHEKSLTSEIVTVSLGVNTIKPKCSNNTLEFISQADSALYEAKEGGRNQYRVYEPVQK